MASLNAPIRLAEATTNGGGPVFYPDDPAFVDNQGHDFNYFYPRYDGFDASKLDVLLGTLLRVRSWQFSMTYTHQIVSLDAAGNPTVYGAKTTAGSISAVAGPVPGQPGDTEMSSLVAFLGMAPFLDVNEDAGTTTIFPPFSANNIFRGTSSTGSGSGPEASMQLVALINGNAADGDFPLLFTFSAGGGSNTLPDGYGRLITANFAATGDGDVYDYQTVLVAGGLTFLGSTWNMRATQGLALKTETGTSGGTEYGTITAISGATITPLEYFSWGGKYNTGTGAAA